VLVKFGLHLKLQYKRTVDKLELEVEVEGVEKFHLVVVLR